MNDTNPAAEATIVQIVRAARRRLGLRRLADRAAVPPDLVMDVARGTLVVDAPPLRRLLSEAEAVVAGSNGAPR
jgi:hypothetical protein